MSISDVYFAALGNQVWSIPGEVISTGAGLNMGLKRKITPDVDNSSLAQMLENPGLSPRRQRAMEMQADIEATGSAVKDLFEGDYEERRKFGVVDIFDTLGFAVSVEPD